MDNPPLTDKRTLSPAYRAQLFAALQQSETMQAGWDKIFQLLQQGQRAAEQAQLPAVAEQMDEGQTLVVQSLRGSGKFLEWELATLEVGLAAGNINRSYQRLQAHYTVLQQFRDSLCRSVTRHVTLVAVMVVVAYAALISTGAFSLAAVWPYVLGSVLILTGSMAWLTQQLLHIVEGRATSRQRRWGGRIAALAAVLRADQLQHFFLSVHQAVSAGLPLTQGLNIAVKKLPHTLDRSAFLAVKQQVAQGGKLSAALIATGLLRDVPVGPMSMRGAGPEQAMAHLTEAVQRYYLERLEQVKGLVTQLPYGLLILLALLQWLLLVV